MNIELPEQNLILSKRTYIEDGVLKIKRNVSFADLMYEFTYRIKGKKCAYCGLPLDESNMTIDHIYPRDFGGPTITNNLNPCCKICNEKKSNMTIKEFKVFKKLKSEDSKREYKRLIRKCQEKTRESGEYILPEGWISETNIEEIIVIINLSDDYKGRKYKLLQEYYKRYGIIKYPIVVDKNGFLLDGFLSLMLAKNLKIKEVRTVVIDNVEIIL